MSLTVKSLLNSFSPYHPPPSRYDQPLPLLLHSVYLMCCACPTGMLLRPTPVHPSYLACHATESQNVLEELTQTGTHSNSGHPSSKCLGNKWLDHSVVSSLPAI